MHVHILTYAISPYVEHAVQD